LIADQRACPASHDLEPVACPREPPETDAFWQAFRRYAGLDHNNYTVGSFGDSAEMATELADLVVAGIKRATASLARDYGDGREPMAKPRDLRRVAVFSTIGIVLATKCRYDKTVAL
jgi:hypothetical protein